MLNMKKWYKPKLVVLKLSSTKFSEGNGDDGGTPGNDLSLGS